MTRAGSFARIAVGRLLMVFAIAGFFFILLGATFSNTPVWGILIGWAVYTGLPFLIGRRLVKGRWMSLPGRRSAAQGVASVLTTPTVGTDPVLTLAPAESGEVITPSSLPPVWLVLFAGVVLGAVVGGAIGSRFVQPAIGFFGAADMSPFYLGVGIGAAAGLAIAPVGWFVVARLRGPRGAVRC